MEESKKFSVSARLSSFKYAFNGLKLFFRDDHNGRVHLFAAILAVLLSWMLKISSSEWIAILTVITLVIGMEMINASIEKLADVVSPAYHLKIKIVKDLAAGAVLMTAILALVVGSIIFVPKLFACIS